MTSRPRVSVLVIAYQHEDFIRETLDSVLAQDLPGVEIIVADDGSTDATQDIVRSYAGEHPDRIVPVLSERNTGVAANQNRALAAVRGEYIAWLDGDDLMLPGKLSRQVALLDAHPEAVVCCHDAEVFESPGDRVLGRFSEMWNGRRGFREGGVELVLDSAYYMIPSSFMFRTSAVPEGGFDTRLRYICEWLVHVEIFRQGRCLAIDDVLSRYRRHAKNITGSADQTRVGLEEGLMVMAILQARHPELTPVIRRRRAGLLLAQAFGMRARGERRESLRFAVTALRDGGLLNVARVLAAWTRVAAGRRRLGAAPPP